MTDHIILGTWTNKQTLLLLSSQWNLFLWIVSFSFTLAWKAQKLHWYKFFIFWFSECLSICFLSELLSLVWKTQIWHLYCSGNPEWRFILCLVRLPLWTVLKSQILHRYWGNWVSEWTFLICFWYEVFNNDWKSQASHLYSVWLVEWCSLWCLFKASPGLFDSFSVATAT